MTWSVAVGSDQRAVAISQLAEKILKNKVASSDRSESEQVLVLYLDDPSVKVRKALAKAVAPFENAPRTVIWGLAQDVCEVAAEIYRKSPILREPELLDAINRQNPLVHCAIAQRPNLQGNVIRCLVKTSSQEAINALLDNDMVVLGPVLKHDIATRLGDVPAIRERLLSHGDLSAATRQMLVQRLSGSLLTLSTSMGWADESRMKTVTQDAANRVAIDISMQTDPGQMNAYVRHLQDTDQLTAALLIRACCLGNAALFETALSLLSGMSLKRVQSIADEGRIAAFRSLYGRTGLPETAYPLFVAAIKAWQTPGKPVDIVMQIIAMVEDNPVVDGELLALLGRISCELQKEVAQTYERQLLLAA